MSDLYAFATSPSGWIVGALALIVCVAWVVLNYQSRDRLALSVPLRCKWGWHGERRYGRCFLCGALVRDDERPER